MNTVKVNCTKPKKRWFCHVWVYVVSVFLLIGVILTIQFSIDNQKAYKRLAGYPVHIIKTEFGKMSYVDEGSGEPVLISHGIF